mmetsp:Transcript_54969/g.170628  ORF Transcript_54969/g.170628 Transcript_54969/m.170628 type:complete len:376 (-) Transcript_54969:95-1222(-)
MAVRVPSTVGAVNRRLEFSQPGTDKGHQPLLLFRQLSLLSLKLLDLPLQCRVLGLDPLQRPVSSAPHRKLALQFPEASGDKRLALHTLIPLALQVPRELQHPGLGPLPLSLLSPPQPGLAPQVSCLEQDCLRLAPSLDLRPEVLCAGPSPPHLGLGSPDLALQRRHVGPQRFECARASFAAAGRPQQRRLHLDLLVLEHPQQPPQVRRATGGVGRRQGRPQQRVGSARLRAALAAFDRLQEQRPAVAAEVQEPSAHALAGFPGRQLCRPLPPQPLRRLRLGPLQRLEVLCRKVVARRGLLALQVPQTPLVLAALPLERLLTGARLADGVLHVPDHLLELQQLAVSRGCRGGSHLLAAGELMAKPAVAVLRPANTQ